MCVYYCPYKICLKLVLDCPRGHWRNLYCLYKMKQIHWLLYESTHSDSMVLRNQSAVLNRPLSSSMPLSFRDHSWEPFNPLTAVWALRALIDFTLSNARRFYSSMGNPLAVKGLTTSKTVPLKREQNWVYFINWDIYFTLPSNWPF